MSAVFLPSVCELSEGEAESSFAERTYSGFFSPFTASLVKITLETPDPGTSNMASNSSVSYRSARRRNTSTSTNTATVEAHSCVELIQIANHEQQQLLIKNTH